MSPKSKPPALKVGAATDVGRVRQQNEDAFIADEFVVGVADGMGGHLAGEVASAIAVTTLRERLGAGAATVELAVAAVVEANRAIFQTARGNHEQRGMGTTLTAMVVLADADQDAADKFVIINVGDSRTYLIRGGRMRRVTVDHSYVQELLSTGSISEVEARSHPRRNIVTRALGIESTVRVDTWVRPFVKGDRYLLCSDGLVDEVDDDEIADVLSANADPKRAADALVAVANRNGGHDNTTVVVVDVLEGEPADETGGMDRDLMWIDQPATGGAISVDADPSLPITAEVPITPASQRRFGVGAMIFTFAVVAIVTLAVTLFFALGNNDKSDPVSPTTVTSTTVSTPTTRLAPTTTTSSTSTSTT